MRRRPTDRIPRDHGRTARGFAAIALLTLGGESIAPFSIALIVGIIVGTYSSIYTASATALLLGVNAQDLIEPVKDPDLIDDLP